MTGGLNLSASDTAQLRELRQLVKQGPVNMVGAKGRRVLLPRPVVSLLDEILKNMQAGKAVSKCPNTRISRPNVLPTSSSFRARSWSNCWRRTTYHSTWWVHTGAFT